MKILCVHGIGHHEKDETAENHWRQAIRDGLLKADFGADVELRFTAYDDLFEGARLDAVTIAWAMAKLSYSGIIHGIGDWLRGPSRGFGELTDTLRWTAGMVAQWADDADLRQAARRRVIADTKHFAPDLILAHSLGSLLTYDAFARRENQPLIAHTTLVTFGSQIGNPFVRSTLGGRIVDVNSRRWFHLFNRHDDAFTAPLYLHKEYFQQVETEFDDPGVLDHDARSYLTHAHTVNTVWRTAFGAGGSVERALEARKRPKGRGKPAESAAAGTLLAAFHIATEKKYSRKRALLIGINDYPDPAHRLEGCLNDNFLVSSVLQECQFAPEDIRMALDDRATAAGIRERLDWLLSDVRDGDVRVFYYSGHGAHIPNRSGDEPGEGDDECLVPYDFDWTPEHAIVDDWFYELYSQLPYESDFLTIFDCCHSGGMTRDGAVRARGLTPPDDLRHRAIQWDEASQMWLPRTDVNALNKLVEKWKPISQRQLSLKRAPEAIAGPAKEQLSPAAVDYFGQSGRLKRIGRAVDARMMASRDAAQGKERFDAAKKDYGHYGPYLPVLLEACQEDQLAYEYRHGVTSYGAFTFALAGAFRAALQKAKISAQPVLPSWNQLISIARDRIAKLQNDQNPVLVCRESYRDTPVPWELVAEKKRSPRQTAASRNPAGQK